MKVLRSIASGLLIILAVPATLRAQPSTDIESYALFAVDGIRAHGLVVTDGNVGVNSATGELFSAFPILAPESQLSANTVRIPLSDCKNLFGNDVVLHSCGQRAAFQSPFNGAGGVEQACDYPVPFPDCDSTGTLGGDVTVGPQEVRRLEPNQYRTVTISRGVQPGRVILTGGDYFFCNLRMGRNADLLFDSAAQVFVSGELELGGMSFTGTGGNDVGAKKIRIIHRGRTLGQESTITIPPRAHVFGQLCAPRSMLRVRYAAQLFGNFIARVIKTDRITVRSFPPCVSTCGNGIRECKEVCDGDVPCGSSATGAFTDSTGGAFVRCLDNCTRRDDSECTTTPHEICGNCIDDDGNGLTDFEDPACCAQVQKFEMSLSKGRIHPRGTTSKLLLKSLLARAGLSAVNPLQEDVFLQIRPSGGTSDLLCAQMPASHFMRRHGAFRFWDRKNLVSSAKGIQDMTIKVSRNGSVKFRTHGKHVQLSNVQQGDLELTVGFVGNAAGNPANQCSLTVQSFRTGSSGALKAP